MTENEARANAATRLAFLGVELFDNGAAIRGAVLVTDTDTKPYEFRITSPVRTSFYQKALYGSTLEDYVHIDLIGVPLIKELREDTDLILISSPRLLDIRSKVPVPVALIASSEILARAGEKQLGGGRLLTVKTHSDFPTEEAVVVSILSPIMGKRDLLEPFDRIRVALTEAHKQRIGEATK